MGTDIHVIEQIKKPGEDEWWTPDSYAYIGMDREISNKIGVGRDSLLFQFLRDEQDMFQADWGDGEESHKVILQTAVDFSIKAGYWGHNSFTLKQLKAVYKTWKACNREAHLCDRCNNDFTELKKARHKFFDNLIVRGKFFLMEGYEDYRVLICFDS